MGENAIDHQCVEGNDDGGREDDVYAQPKYWNALFYCIRVVEGVVLERKVLVEGRDLIDSSEDANEEACTMSAHEAMGKVVV